MSNIPHKDKWLHALVGACIGLLAFVLQPAWVFLITLVVATGKEVYDKVSGKGTPEVADIAATVLGTAVVCVLLQLGGFVWN